MKPQVQKFLERHMLDADQISMDSLCDMFISEMKAGLAGRSSSLAMIPSFCSPDARPKAGEAVLVIDAGGTNFRTCLVTFDKSLNPVISDFRKSSMPGIKKEVSASEFFSTIADEAERLIDRSDRIGFCFSYAAEILPDHDGVPQFFSKEIKAPEVIGKHLGKELLAEFARRGHDVSKKKVIILNDTVTTLLAAKADSHAASYDGCIGFILGTGTNQPDNYKLEKMISGAYLGPLAFHVISHAVKEGLFSQAFCDAFSRLEALPTHELSAFLAGDETNALYACAKDEDDYDTLLELMGSFIARAAKLTAANLASAVLITDFGKDEDHPVLINADGTTFHKTAFLKSYTTEYLDAFLSEKGRRAVITQIENSPTIGSAVGALTL